MQNSKIYFPNLNGLRFIAALMVIIHHIEQIKYIFKFSNIWGSSPFIIVVGKLGVVLFFVLSGFLISYLLLVEEDTYKRISIKKFYIRRILRIWPLYFFIGILAFIILPNISFFTLPGFSKTVIYNSILLKSTLFILFLPNLTNALLYIIPYAAQAWSIGTEEQFYIVWPILNRLFKNYRIILMLTIIAIYLLIKSLFYNSNYSIFYTFWTHFNIDCMAIGGLFAILLFRKSSLLNILMNTYLFYTTLIVTLFMICKGIQIEYLHYEIYAILFGIIILNLAANKSIRFSLENKPLNYLGKISYGLYMYHPICLVFSLKILSNFGIYNYYSMLFSSILITIIIASFSYHFIEAGFIKLKSRFTLIVSGNKA